DDNCSVEQGRITSKMIETSLNIIDYISNNESEQCFLGEGGGIDARCNIGPSSENPIWLNCSGSGDYLNCELALNTEFSSPYSIDCYKYQEGGGQCTINTNADAFNELIPELPNSNWGSLVSGFLGSCMSSAFG